MISTISRSASGPVLLRARCSTCSMVKPMFARSADGLVPEEFIGLHRFKKDGMSGARELVVQRMKELGCLIPHVTKNKDGEDVKT